MSRLDSVLEESFTSHWNSVIHAEKRVCALEMPVEYY